MQVSRANAIIAELLRLSDYIPPLFKVTHEERVRVPWSLFVCGILPWIDTHLLRPNRPTIWR